MSRWMISCLWAIESAPHLRADLRDLLGVERAVAAHAALKIGAVKQLHHDVIGVAILAPVVDAYDVGALQGCCCLGFLLEARGERGVSCILGQHDFDRYGTVQNLVLSTENRGHATGSDLLLKEVPSSQQALLLRHSYSSHFKCIECILFIYHHAP